MLRIILFVNRLNNFVFIIKITLINKLKSVLITIISRLHVNESTSTEFNNKNNLLTKTL